MQKKLMSYHLAHATVSSLSASKSKQKKLGLVLCAQTSLLSTAMYIVNSRHPDTKLPGVQAHYTVQFIASDTLNYLRLALYLPYMQGLFTMTNNGNSLPLVPVAAYNS